MTGFNSRFQLIFFVPFLIVLITATSLSSKEKTTIIGFIRDEITLLPIKDVNVYCEKYQIGAVTNDKGYFQITNMPIGNLHLIIEHIGYHTHRLTLSLRAGEVKKINVKLSPKTIPLQGVTFTANRTLESVFRSHQSVTIASRDKIESRTSPNTADALREIAGVLVQKTTAGHGAPIIRGMIGKDVLLLYNSIRLNKPTFRFGANQYMNTINAEILERIEVVKGPGSVMYGSDAIGGLVNMIPFFPTDGYSDHPFQNLVSLRYGSADRSRLANAVITHQLSNFFLLANFGMKKFGDLTAGKDVGKQIPTGYKEWDGNFKLNYFFNPQTQLEWDLLTVVQTHVPRYDKYVTGQYQKYEYALQSRFLAAVTLHHQPISKSWLNKLRWNFSFQFEEEKIEQQKAGKNYEIQNNNELTTWGSYLQMNSLLPGNHVLTYGYELYFDRVHSLRYKKSDRSLESLRPTFPDGSTYFSSGIFLNDQWIIRPDFDITIGLRWSQIMLSSNLGDPFGNFEDRNSDFTGTIGFSYQVLRWFNVIATYARGFRAPNFNDTVVLKVSNAGMDAPSPGLKPEKSHNFELGVKWNQANFTGSFFVFYNQLKDLIDRYKGSYLGLTFFDEDGDGVRDADEVDIYQKHNAGIAYITGWEASSNFRVNQNWEIHGFIFWTYGQNKTLNEPMSRIPPLMGMISLKFLPSPGFQMEAFIRAAGKQSRLSTRDKDDSRIPEGGTPGWKTFNLRCRYLWRENWSFHVTVENIFDETYKEHGSGVYSAGRNFVISLRFQK